MNQKRECLIKRFIPIQWEYVDINGNVVDMNDPAKIQRYKVKGTGVIGEFEPAEFEHWGLDMDEGASYTVAIVILPDGTCDMINVTNIKFIGSEKDQK